MEDEGLEVCEGHPLRLRADEGRRAGRLEAVTQERPRLHRIGRDGREEADELLKRWGMSGDPDKIVMGYQSSQKAPRTIIVESSGHSHSTDEEGYWRRGGRRHV